MKKDAYYFSHDSNAQDDPKCMLLIDQLGMEGYGIFWGLIEKLRAEKDYRLPLSIASAFARRWCTSKEKVETVITKFDLFKIDGNDFFSIRLLRSMQEKSEKARISVMHRYDKQKLLIQSNTNEYDRIRTNTIKGKEKENKEKKIENENEYEIKFQTRLGKIDPEIKKLFLEFCDQKKIQRKPVTAQAGYILLGNLWELSQEPAIQKKIIEQSIARSYSDFFPISGGKPEEKKNLEPEPRYFNPLPGQKHVNDD